MAESMVGLKRSHRCTEVSSADIGKKVTVRVGLPREEILVHLFLLI